MNQLTIIGNLTKDPVLQTVDGQDGPTTVCRFTVAVNSRRGDDKAEFFAVSAWRKLGENCGKFLAKGRKVMVQGPVSVRTYETENGEHRAQLQISSAEKVEFLSSKSDIDQQSEQQPTQQPAKTDSQTGFEQVNIDTDELPF